MLKRISGVACAALLLMGMSAAATNTVYETPALVTGVLPLNYIGISQCIANNGGISPVATHLAIINAVTNTVVASDDVLVPGHGQAVLSYQALTAQLVNHFCVASPQTNNTETNGDCVPGPYEVPMVPSALAPIRLQFWNNLYTNDPIRTDGLGNLINQGIFPRCDA